MKNDPATAIMTSRLADAKNDAELRVWPMSAASPMKLVSLGRTFRIQARLLTSMLRGMLSCRFIRSSHGSSDAQTNRKKRDRDYIFQRHWLPGIAPLFTRAISDKKLVGSQPQASPAQAVPVTSSIYSVARPALARLWFSPIYDA